MTFDHVFGYSFLFEEEKENKLVKIEIKGHALLLDPFDKSNIAAPNQGISSVLLFSFFLLFFCL